MNIPFSTPDDILDQFPELKERMADPADATRIFASQDNDPITLNGMEVILKCPEWATEILHHMTSIRKARVVVTATHNQADKHNAEILIERLSPALDRFHVHTQQDEKQPAECDMDTDMAHMAIGNVLKATLCTPVMPVEARIMVEPRDHGANFHPFVLRRLSITSMPPVAEDAQPRPIRGVIQPGWMNNDKLIL